MRWTMGRTPPTNLWEVADMVRVLEDWEARQATAGQQL